MASVVLFLKKRFAKILTARDTSVKGAVRHEKKYIASFREPVDDISRSYNQYRCQARRNGGFITLVSNLVAIPMLFAYAFKKNTPLTEEDEGGALFFDDGKPSNIVPACLREEFKVREGVEEGFRLTKEDKAYFRSIRRRYPLSPSFAFRILLKLGRYRYAIDNYNPKAIIG